MSGTTTLKLFLLLTIIPLVARGQFYSVGQDPASVKWVQIQTDNFQIIFPEEYSQQASEIADILEYSYTYASKSLQHQPRKVSVIIHNQTVISNGFVSWAPRRAELFNNAPANNDAHNWMERLALHEFRHVVQVDKLNQGVTRILGHLLGEQAVGAVLGLYVPLWFLEGDAVIMETAGTHAGRGRQPVFEQGLRAQVLSYGTYSFDKAVYGSYKDHVPNQYELGYKLVAAARIEHGADIWSPVLDNVAQKPWSLTPFSSELRRQTGRNKTRHYHHTLSLLDSVWSRQKQLHTYTTGKTISPVNKLHTNYTQAYFADDSTIVALKTGLEDIPKIIRIHKDGSEETLFAPGRFFPNGFHYSSGKIVWNELHPDPRWEHRNWSDIYIYNIEDKQRTRLTRKGRYFAPSLSPDGSQVAVVQTTAMDEYSLVVLDVHTGEDLYSFSYPENDFIMQPTWHPYGHRLAFVVQNQEGKRIDMLDLQTHKLRNILPASFTEISSPQLRPNKLIFTGAWSGINSIYQVDLHTQKVQKLISPLFGADFALMNSTEELILYSDYTAQGFQLAVAEWDTWQNKPLSEVQDHSAAFHRELSQQEDFLVSAENIPQGTHTIEPYSRIRNLFHLHSWAPVYIDGFSQEAHLGASMLFQNKLSTSFATLGYIWDQEQQTGKLAANWSYRGWYPVIDVLAETGQGRAYYTYREQETRNFLYQENRFRLALSVPLRFHHNEYIMGITPWFRLGFNQARAGMNTPGRIFVNSTQYFQLQDHTYYLQEYRIFAYRQRRSVARDIYPRFGQIIDLNYRHNPVNEYYMGSVSAARAIIYFPGLAPHHGLRLSGGIQNRSRSSMRPGAIRYSFGNFIPYPRGISQQNHSKLNSFSADYAFPLLYPDLSIPPLLYLMRLRASVFGDYAMAQRFPVAENPGAELNEEFYSYGFSITGDMHLFRFVAPLSLGIEVAFPSGEETHFNLLMGVRF